MEQRLQKILADAGIGSRRGCEKLILEGRVSVNRRAVTRPGAKADPERDVVAVDGERVRPARKVYLMLNKPPGFICSSRDEKGRRTVHDLLKGVRERLYTVGRLDADAEGLLLLTNDGDFAQRVAHPRGTIGKTYQVEIKGALDAKGRRGIERGIVLDGRRTLPADILREEAFEGGERVVVRIREGRNRQVKRIFLAVGRPVRRLRRIAIGGLSLGGLSPGAWRRMDRGDIDRLFAGAGKGAPPAGRRGVGGVTDESCRRGTRDGGRRGGVGGGRGRG